MSTMEWKRNEICYLIDKYKEFPVLWNVKLNQYRDRNAKHLAFIKFHEKMVTINKDITIDHLKKKIHTLRSQYNREVRNVCESIKAGDEGDELYSPKLWCFELLFFLSGDLQRPIFALDPNKDVTTEHVGPNGGDLSRGMPDQKVDPMAGVGAMGGSEAGSTQDSLGDSAMEERPMPLSPEQFLTEEDDHPGMPQESNQSMPAAAKRPESYKLRHNNHLSIVFESLAGDEAFMDVTLTAQGRSIKAHKSVLSAVSPYFNGVLRENPCQHPIIIMPRDVKFKEINNIIRYIYRGEMTVPAEELSSLLKTAEILQVSGLSPSDGNMAGFITSSLLDQKQTPGCSENTTAMPSFSMSNLNQNRFSPYKKDGQATHLETSINPADFVNADLSCVKEELPSDDEGMDEMIPNESTLDPLSLSTQNSPHQSTSRSATQSSNEDLSRTSLGTSINITPHLSSDGLQKMKIPPSTGESLSTPPLGTPPLATPPLGTPPSEASPLSIQPWQCPHCENKGFVRGYDFMFSHLGIKHQSKASFLCECGRVFTKKSDKLEHKKSCSEG